MTVPTLILIGARDDVNSADECRKLVSGRDSWGISRQANQGIPVRLVVYPDASHAFDAPDIEKSASGPQHHFEFNPAATDQAAQDLRSLMQQSAERLKSNDDQSRRVRRLRDTLRHPVGR
ncbi:dienelactone hydrolase family protein [Bradyrhizobium manausense]|uniref:dienelactone hydrolase family protein n=1 Tax=Bradyrhizobium manausense TaxID=989370 RepID=UPI002011CA21|nr:dienelactone hydrolase family protein [Bradyrhizobium manausense]